MFCLRDDWTTTEYLPALSENCCCPAVHWAAFPAISTAQCPGRVETIARFSIPSIIKHKCSTGDGLTVHKSPHKTVKKIGVRIVHHVTYARRLPAFVDLAGCCYTCIYPLWDTWEWDDPAAEARDEGTRSSPQHLSQSRSNSRLPPEDLVC